MNDKSYLVDLIDRAKLNWKEFARNVAKLYPEVFELCLKETSAHNSEKYDPALDTKDAICQCGHVYYRHFDTYEDMAPVGCKYCDCGYYRPIKDNDPLGIDALNAVFEELLELELPYDGEQMIRNYKLRINDIPHMEAYRIVDQWMHDSNSDNSYNSPIGCIEELRKRLLG